MLGGNANDMKHARAVLQTACDSGDGPGCFNLALALEKGQGGKKGAAAARTKACDAGYKEACSQ